MPAMNNLVNILLVEDEAPIRHMLRFTLEAAGFDVSEAADCKAARDSMAKRLPQLIILDWMLPQQSGIDFTRQLKKDQITRDIPIIMLTAKADEDNKIRGLECGADDYVVKPFSPRELVARIRTVLRRGPMLSPNDRITVGKLQIDLKAQTVSVAGMPVKLGRLEYRLLLFLVTHPDRVYSRDELLTHVWSGDTYIDERTVDVVVRRARKELAKHYQDKCIKTKHGSGYYFSMKAYEDTGTA